jgi:large subunit ribosomal protein L25
MATLDLKGELRTALGKAEANRLRRVKRIPGIVYGGAKGPIPVTVNPVDLLTVLTGGENVLINLALQGGAQPETHMVIVKDLQLDPVKGRPLHADFLEVSMERKIRVEVPLTLTGEPVGVKSKGGILGHQLRQLHVECLPLQIPESLSVDVSGLDVGNAIHVRDLTVGEGIRVLDDPERVIASVTVAAAEEAPAVAEEEAPAEPEIVGRKEKAEGEGEAEGKPEGKAGAKAESKAGAKAESKPEAKPEAKSR